MTKPLSILCVHGVGHGDNDGDLVPSWTDAIRQSLQRWDADIPVTVDFLRYDALFEGAPLNPVTYAEALAKLLASGITHGIGDLFGARGLLEISQSIRWTAGMVAQWVSEEELRDKACAAVLQQMTGQSYDVVCAHSLGSLICYDTFRRNPAAISGKYFVTLGSQIGNPCVRDVFAGRIEPVAATTWYHLYNPDDHVLTAEIRLSADNFTEVNAEFDIPHDMLNHDPAHYLAHANTRDTVWHAVAGVGAKGLASRSLKTFAKLSRKPQRRALLVGINDYPDLTNHLDGCVNDVFLMSSLLQESNFKPEEIRVVLNERATTANIMERLHWLLDDVKDGDERVLFYSGHGAQIPAYGAQDEVDHLDECLVPYDFDWTAQHAITDKQIYKLYAQLPYDSRFLAIFDCCHAGGMSRDGAHRVRGITPPDDIRHRALQWNAQRGMWEDRPLQSPNPDIADKDYAAQYVGSSGAAFRLGRAMRLRSLPNKEFDQRCKTYGHHGPYLPIIMEACRESQLSYEYRHGVTSYGAYTFSLAQVLRSQRAAGNNLSFVELSKLVSEQLQALKYDQKPCLLGPKAVTKQDIPWLGSGAVATKKTTQKISKRKK